MFSDEGQSGTSLETIPPSSRFQFKFQLGNESNLIFIGVELWQHCRWLPPSFHTTQFFWCKFSSQVKTATDLFRQVEEKVLGVAHGNSEDLDGMSHDRERAWSLIHSCMRVAYWYYVYLWPIITNNYWNNFRFELGVRVGKEWSGYVRIVPLHHETAGEWRQQIKRQSFARLLLWVLQGKMQWYQYNV